MRQKVQSGIKEEQVEEICKPGGCCVIDGPNALVTELSIQ